MLVVNPIPMTRTVWVLEFQHAEVRGALERGDLYFLFSLPATE